MRRAGKFKFDLRLLSREERNVVFFINLPEILRVIRCRRLKPL